MARTSEYEAEEMRRLLAKAGYSKSLGKWEYFRHRDMDADAAEENGRAAGRKQGIAEGRRQVAELVISVYGLDYPDSTHTEEATRLGGNTFGSSSRFYFPGYETYERTVTTPGSDAFLRDIESVANGQKVKGARKRLGL